MNSLKELEGPEDVKVMVDAFYRRVRSDSLLGPVFEERVEDWAEHMPTLYAFWGSILFGQKGYAGNPLAKHLPMPLEKIHFDRWIKIFMETVDGHFVGEHAERAKSFAKSVAHTFQIRMGIDPYEERGPID